MRIVVFSDTHGNAGAIDNIVERNKEVKHFIFLGDGQREVERAVEKYPDKEFHIVAGNCDFASKLPKEGFLEIGGHKILFTHGHAQAVGFSLDRLCYLALYNNADIALFGHTHARHYEYTNGVHMLNPGSASAPRDGNYPSYAFIDIEKGGIVYNHVSL